MGLFSGAQFVERTVTLEEGDVLVLYTDGVTEAYNEDEEEFGEERLEALVVQNLSRPAQKMTNLIIEAAVDFATEEGMVDDETLVVIKRRSDVI